MSNEIQPSDRDEIRIANNLSLCNQTAGQVGAQLQNYPEQFKQRLNTDMQSINNEQQARFSWVSDPKLLDYSVHIEGLGDRKIREY